VAQTVTLTNTGNATLNVVKIQIAGDYSQTNTCAASLAPSASCTMSITFAPSISGTRSGTLTITDNATGSPQTLNFVGTGADFSLASTPVSNSLKAGATATYQLVVLPVGGAFAASVKLACTGAPALTTCKISPSAVTPNASAAAATLTITTTAFAAQARAFYAPESHPVYAILLQLQGIGLFGLLLAGPRRSRKVNVVLLPILLVAATMFMSACAGGTGIVTPPPSGTTAGTYKITVTATSGSLQHSLPVTLVVQ
jgi:hypothetical protein